MERWLSDRPVYAPGTGGLKKVADGVTHYCFDFEAHMVGEALMHELHAAGVAGAMVVQMGGVDKDGKGPAEVRIPGDDKGKLASKVEKAIAAHKGTKADDHKRLVEFTGSVHEAVAKVEAGGSLTEKERDILLAVSMRR